MVGRHHRDVRGGFPGVERRRRARRTTASPARSCSSSPGASAATRATQARRRLPLAGLFGEQVELADGQTVVADENYIRESILNPSAKVVKGYQPIMPSYQGRLTDEEVFALVTYIQSLGDGQRGRARRGKSPAGTAAHGHEPGGSGRDAGGNGDPLS